MRPFANPYGPCPSCDSPDVVRVPGRSRPAYSAIPVTAFRGVTTSLRVCLSCGRVEEKVDDQADLDALRKRYGDQLSR